jgi:murein DD-endopeptidase MepM/ murein hydrolase activator NlpD
VFSGWNCEIAPGGGPDCYGNVVVIDHGNGLYSIYTHLLSTGLAPLGQMVTPSTQIGVMSNSGCPGCAVHLHYAMHIGKTGLTGRLALYDPSLKAVRTPWHKP